MGRIKVIISERVFLYESDGSTHIYIEARYNIAFDMNLVYAFLSNSVL